MNVRSPLCSLSKGIYPLWHHWQWCHSEPFKIWMLDHLFVVYQKAFIHYNTTDSGVIVVRPLCSSSEGLYKLWHHWQWCHSEPFKMWMLDHLFVVYLILKAFFHYDTTDSGVIVLHHSRCLSQGIYPLWHHLQWCHSGAPFKTLS